jgi:dihydroorotase
MRSTGARVHLCRLSTRDGVDMVRAAKREGLPISCDIGIHHAHMSEMDLGYFDAHCHLRPPLRSARDRDALRQGLKDGTIDALCSDHAPVDKDSKLLPFAESEAGATGLELLLPLTLKWAQEMNVPLAQALARITQQPARILGVDAGRLSEGHIADVCIFDAEQYCRISAAGLKSQGKNTPFLGMELPGKVRYTLLQGQVVYDAGHG